MRIESPSVSRITNSGARYARVLALLSLAAQVANYFLALWVHESDGLFLLGVFLLMVVLFVSVIAMTVLRREATPGVLAVGQPGTVVIGDVEEADALCIRPSRVRGGFVEQITGVHQVTLQRHRDAIVIRAESADHANAILEAANVAAAQRVLTLPVSGQGNPGARGLIGGVWLLSSLWCIASLVYVAIAVGNRDISPEGAVFAIVPWVLFAMTARSLLDRPITIGRDGVRFGAAGAWFLPYRGLTVVVDGRFVVFNSERSSKRVKTASVAEARAIAHRIDAARNDSNAAMARDVVARGGRGLAEWRDHLRGLIDVRGDYRAAALGPAELAALTEDGLAPPDVRVGAAVALSVLPADNPERARVRVAIDTAANPKLRSALERALEGEVDDAALAAA